MHEALHLRLDIRRSERASTLIARRYYAGSDVIELLFNLALVAILRRFGGWTGLCEISNSAQFGRGYDFRSYLYSNKFLSNHEQT